MNSKKQRPKAEPKKPNEQHKAPVRTKTRSLHKSPRRV